MELVEETLLLNDTHGFTPATKEEICDAFNYYDIPIPIQLEYDADWPN